MTVFSQLKDNNMGKYISSLGRIFRVLNIDHISHAIPDAVVFDDVLMCPYLEKRGLLVILFMAI